MGERNQPALVTGATGCIGRRLVARLVDEGFRVRALVLPTEEPGELLPAEVEVVRGDVTNPAAVRRAVEGAGTVFHLAAVVGDWGAEDRFEAVTVRGTATVLRALRHTDAHLLLASTIAVYGHSLGRDVCDEEHPLGTPQGVYSRAKQAQERLARRMAEEHHIKLTVVRPANVYGPASGPWVHSVMATLRAGLPSLIGTGEQDGGLVYVDNLVDVFVRAASTEAAIGSTYNAADGFGVSWARYMGDLARLSGSRPPQSIPAHLARALAHVLEPLYRVFALGSRPPITLEALNLVGSHHRLPIDRARDELGYQPPVSYDDGMAETARYIREAGL